MKAFCKNQQLSTLEKAGRMLAKYGATLKEKKEKKQNPKGSDVSHMQINIEFEKEN